jgi:hypothetical protein
MPLPPWLNIAPRDYLAAVESGTRAGLSIRQADQQAQENAQHAWENAQRMQMEAEAQQQRQQQIGVENQQNRLAQERLEQYRQGELQLAQSRQSMPESPLGKLMMDRQTALGKGDKETASQFDAAIQEQISNKGRSIYMGQDDQGRPVFQMSEGGASPIGKPTVATQSLAQGKQLQYQNATELMNWLERNLKPEHVGLAGKTGEFLVDKTLSQIFPEVANKDRINVRSTLDMAQGLAREIVDSPSGRFSNVERDAVLGALPSTGVFESYPDAVARLQRAKEVLRSRGKVYSTQLGQPVPTWTLSKEEIKDRYLKGKTSGLKPEDPKFKSGGFLTEEDALDALQRFH